MNLNLRSTTLFAAAACALALAGCSNSTRSDMGQSGAPFCQNGSSCQGPIWFNANGEIINGSPADASSQRRSDGPQSYRSDERYDQRRDQSWDHRSERDRTNAGRTDGRGAWVSASEENRILSSLHAKNQRVIEMGRLAQERGVSEDARRLGDMLVRDHTDADAQVLNTADAAHIALFEPSMVHAMMMRDNETSRRSGMPMHMDPVAELRNVQGSDFDRVFGQKVLEGHRQCIERVTAARSNVTNAQVRELLDNLLPTLRRHAEMAEGLATR